MTMPTSVAELQSFQPKTGRDRYGLFHILTGYEGTGRCFWCGGALKGRRETRYCRGDHHWRLYADLFWWPAARNRCIERQDGKCANCGIHKGRELEVHHIIPLNAGERAYTPFNLPWNLIALCHDCHQQLHAAMRPDMTLDYIDRACRRGQAVMKKILDIDD